LDPLVRGISHDRGRDTCRAALDRAAGGAFDLILMDVQMPEQDGPSATREIRAAERASGRQPTPIIALTANAMSHQVAEYQAAGMDGFVAKPIEIAQLFGAIEAALEGGERKQAAVA